MLAPDASPRWHVGIAVFACYVLLLALLSFVVQDVSSEPNVWAVTLDRLVTEGIGLGDPTSFAVAARDIYETGWIRVENAWIFKLWPPGIPLIEAASLAVFGRDAPLLAILQGLAVLLHSFASFALYLTLRRYVPGSLAIVSGVLPFAFPITRVFLLHPTGVALGETFAVGFFVLGMLGSISAIRRSSYSRAVAAGICLALSAYLRSQFEIILTIQALVAALILIFALTGALYRFRDARASVGSLVCVAVIVLSTQGAMLPWRTVHLVQDGTPQWVFTSALAARNSVMSDADLIAEGGSFVVRGGGTVGCKIAPDTCGNQSQAEALFYQTFLQHPVEWLAYKVSLMPAYWFAPVGNWVTVDALPSPFDVIYNLIIALAIIASFVMIFISPALRRDKSWIALVLFTVTLLLSYGAICTFVHFEARYFFFPKVIGMIMALISIAILVAKGSDQYKPTT